MPTSIYRRWGYHNVWHICLLPIDFGNPEIY
ncbi:unnamed protein product, partial [marine sediment metagenome]